MWAPTSSASESSQARDHLLRQADTLADADQRRCYLTEIPVNRRTIELAEELL